MFELLFRKHSLLPTDNLLQDETSKSKPVGTVFQFRSESAPDMQELDDRFTGMLLCMNTVRDSELNGAENYDCHSPMLS